MPKPWTEIVTEIIRARLPFSWLDLAIECQITWHRMERLQANREEPTLNEARRIARSLGLGLDHLWGDRAGEIAWRRDADAADAYGFETPGPSRAELLAMRLVMQIAKDVGPLTALSNLIATHRYHAQEIPAPCSNTSASPAASTAPRSASPAST